MPATFLWVLVAVAVAERDVGLLMSHEGFAYLGKFCFDYTRPKGSGLSPYDGSRMTFDLTLKNIGSGHYQELQVLLYDDEPQSWPSIYQQGRGYTKSCHERVARAKNARGRTRGSNSTSMPKNRFTVHFDEDRNWVMPHIHVHEHQRPRFWYVVLANCKGFHGVEYKAEFLNQGPYWKREFGVNEQGLNIISSVFLSFYSCMSILHIWMISKYREKAIYHPLLQLYSISILAQALSFACMFAHTWTFTFTGIGIPICNSLSELLFLASRLTLLLFLLLVAQGWGTVKIGINYRESLFGLLGGFCMCYFLLLLWDVKFRDPASTLYLYESIPGVFILILDILATVWYVLSARKTLQVTPNPNPNPFYSRHHINRKHEIC
ncbi:hypothetical protein AAMO2058_001348300 [Amorphochlora amoebiformis]